MHSLVLFLSMIAVLAGAEPLLNSDHGLALHGYDPVTYQLPGGPQRGDPAITAVVGDGTYRFASTGHRDTLLARPDHYLPAYGGWCAYAMASADFVDVDPKTFKLIDGRLYLFYNGWLGNTLTAWNKDEAGLHAKADAAWSKLVTERGGK